jgi:hypothetical protein
MWQRSDPIHPTVGKIIKSRLSDGLALLLAILYGGYVAIRGPVVVTDSNTYADWADVLIANSGDFAATFAAIDFPGGSEALAAGSVGLIALLKLLLGPAFWHGYVAINWAAISVAALAMLRLGRTLGLSRTALVFGAAFLGLTWEYLYWSAYANTDMIFVGFAASTFAALCASAASRTQRVLPLVIGLGLGATTVVIRPAGLWLVAFCVAFHVLALPWFPEATKRRRHALAIVMVTLASLAVGTFAVSQILVDPSWISHPALAELVDFVRSYNLNGEVIRDRPHTFVTPPTTALDFARLIGLKMVYYFAFVIEGFGHVHNMINALAFIPLYGLALAGAAATVATHPILDRGRQIAGLAAIVFIVIFTFAHAATIIDFDLRYRLPCYPPLIWLAMLGVDCYLVPFTARLHRMFTHSSDAGAK